MRILALSDIFWGLTSLQALKDRIEEIHPDLVLVAGDLVNDMLGYEDGEFVSRETYWKRAHALFRFLNDRKIRTLTIRGNWDYSKEYDRTVGLVGKRLHYVKDISDNIERVGDLVVLGLSYGMTNNLKEIRKLANEFHGPVDIILAHAEMKRRVWLCHFNAQIIITGHYDQQLCQVQDKVFISLGDYPGQHVVIDHQAGGYEIRYYEQMSHGTIERRARFARRKLTWKAKAFQQRGRYGRQVESLMAARAEMAAEGGRPREIVRGLLCLGVPKKHIEEYLQISLRSKRYQN